MKINRISFIMLFLLDFGLKGVNAQETITASGGNATGSGGSASYSVGQVAYQTYTRTNGSVAEGVQQPFKISVVIGIEEAKGINLSVSAYPNPTTDYLTLSINEDVKTTHDLSLMSYQLYDIQGKLLQNGKITGSQTRIAMGNLVPATYFVKVYAAEMNDRKGMIQDNTEVHHVKSNEVGAKQFNAIKTFKIIKQ